MAATERRPGLARLTPAVLAVGLFAGPAAAEVVAPEARVDPTAYCATWSPPEDRARAFEGDARRDIGASDLTCRTDQQIRELAARHGLEGHGRPGIDGRYRRFRDAATGVERLRLDQGHRDPQTGRPYKDPRAAVPHVHGYYADGDPIRDPRTGNTHFPLLVGLARAG